MDFLIEKPIFVQIAEFIEDGIISGAFPEDSQVPSTTEISIRYKVNPATALKGINILVDDGVVYKKRGLGMFVTIGARKAIRNKRKGEFYENYISKAISEAKKLNITIDEVISMIKGGCDQ